MTRPLYETSADLSNEQAVAKLIAESWVVTVTKLKPKYRFDYAMKDSGGNIAFMEIKCRTFPSTQYDSYLISADKVWNALSVRNNTGEKTFLVVAWTDRVGYRELDGSTDHKLIIGGRTDRGDEQDVEPCFLIPVKLFKFIT